MDHSFRVQMVEAEDNLGDIASRPVFFESSHGFDESCTVAAVEIFHDQVQIIPTLEGPEQLHDKFRRGLVHHDDLRGHSRQLPVLFYVLREDSHARPSRW